MEIGAKISYEKNSGNVILITSEMCGSCEERSKELDMDFYSQLKDYNIDDVDFIQLEYGTMAKTFENLKSYSINTETKKLECIYFTKEEIEEMQNYTEQYVQDQQIIVDRNFGISEYLIENPNSIADVENYILQNEINKIMEGVN